MQVLRTKPTSREANHHPSTNPWTSNVPRIIAILPKTKGITAPRNYPLRYPIYQLIETIGVITLGGLGTGNYFGYFGGPHLVIKERVFPLRSRHTVSARSEEFDD